LGARFGHCIPDLFTLLRSRIKGYVRPLFELQDEAYLFVGRSELADVALRSMCTLLTNVTHFNFRVNLMGCIIARLSKRSWDEVSADLFLLYVSFCRDWFSPLTFASTR
jgi:hypothetical protein